MKKLILGACLLSASTLGFAEEGEVKDRSGAYGMVSLVQTQFDIARNLKDEDSAALSLGWMFNKNWAVEGHYTYMNELDKTASSWEPIAGGFDLESYGLDFIYNDTHWLGNASTSPFFKFGMGKYNVDNGGSASPYLEPSQFEDSEYIKLGLGIQHFASKHAFIRAGVDFLDGDSDLGDDKLFYFGVGYFFGATEYDGAPAKVEAPKQAPKDSDGDGVIDADDRCPGTPAGAKVDAYGCPVDSDGDGVYDYQDACPNTPAGAKVDEKGCQVKAEKVVVDMRLNFDTNKYAIKPEMVSEIAKVAEFLRQFSDVDAQIQGHTDSVGASSYNQGLSERRANSVVNYLVSNFGIDKARLTAVGYGEERPIADNATAEGRALNRRAEANLESK